MRRIVLFLAFMAIIVTPAVAQSRVPVPDVTRYAEYVPDASLFFAAFRTDVGFREQTNALCSRLGVIGSSSGLCSGFVDGLINDTELAEFVGDGIALAVLPDDPNPRDLFGPNSQFVMIFGVRDTAKAREFLRREVSESPQTRGGWEVFEDSSNVTGLLRGDVMIAVSRADFAEQLISGDYGKLSNSADFRASLDRLPGDVYDVVLYADVKGVLEAEQSPSANSALVNAVGSVLGHIAIGGVNVVGRDLVLDVAHSYGDLSALGAFGFTPDSIVSSPVDLSFAGNVPAETDFYLQSRGFGGALRQTFTLLNVAGGIMEADASTEFFGLEGIINANLGDTAKAAAAFGLMAATGLRLQEDVIDVLKGDFAFYGGFMPLPAPLDFGVEAGVLLSEDGQGAAYTNAVVNALDRLGVPIRRITERGSVNALDLSGLTRPLVRESFGDLAADDASTDVWFGTGGGVMALGTAPSVRFAIAIATGSSLADTPAFQHAVASTFLPDAQGIGYINIKGLALVGDIPQFTDVFESASASYIADESGVIARFAVTLQD